MRFAYPTPTPLTNAHDDVESLLRCPYCATINTSVIGYENTEKMGPRESRNR